MGPITYTLPFYNHLTSWFQERQSRCSLTTAWILTQLQNDEPILSHTLILAPVQWDIMTKITNAQNADQPPPNCSPGKSYVPLFFCSPLCFWWPTTKADTITHVQNGSMMVPQANIFTWKKLFLSLVTHFHILFYQSFHLQRSQHLIHRSRLLSKACQLILCNYMFRFYGLLEHIVSDRGPHFTSLVWAAFYQQLNINVSLLVIIHNLMFKLNQELTRFIKTFWNTDQLDWSYYQLWAENAQTFLRKPSK